MESLLPYASAVLKLLKGAVNYDLDPKEWNQLSTYQNDIRKYFEKIGLGLYMDTDDGFAYVYQPGGEDDSGLPRVTRRMPLPFDVTILLVVLREKLTDTQIQEGKSAVILKKDEIYELMSAFYPKSGNETGVYREIDRIIVKVIELGFLRKLDKAGSDLYQIENILKVRIKGDELHTIKRRLQENNDRKSE